MRNEDKPKIILILLAMLWIINILWLVLAFQNEQTPPIQTNDLSIPDLEDFNKIVQTPYVLNEYDCSNKAADYYRALKSKGYSPVIYVVQIKSNSIYHAIVGLPLNHQFLFLDPTQGTIYTEFNNDEYIFVRQVDENELKTSKEWL